MTVEGAMGFMTAGHVYNAAIMSTLGYSASEVGKFMSIVSIINMFAPLFWGFVSDKTRSVKKTMSTTVLVSIIIYAPLFLYAKINIGGKSIAPYVILLSSLVVGASGQLLTSWVMESRREHPSINFGVVRLFWSLLYAVACFGYATFMKKFEGMAMYTIPLVGFGISGLVTLFFIKVSPGRDAEGAKKQSLKDMPIGDIIKNPRILVYLSFSIFITVPTLGLNNFMQYLLADVNGSKAILGYMVGIRSLCAIPFMFFSDKIHKKIGTRNAMSLAAVLYGIAQILFMLAQNTFQIISICIFQGIAFGLLVPTQVLYINQYAPAGLIATTQTMVTVANSLSQSLFSTIGGNVVENLGIRTFYAMSAVACVVSFTLFNVGNKVLDKTRGVD